MCISWTFLFCSMSFKNRKFSLDSSFVVDGDGVFVVRKSSRKFKKSKQTLEDARLEIQELNHSLNSSVSLRNQAKAEDGLERSDELINNHTFLKRNKSFRKLFQEIPEGESLIHTFTCALQKEVLYHGKLFVSENHVCFHSSFLLKDTKVVIPVSSIKQVKKHNAALSILSIQTADEKYSFVSLMNRELCYKFLQSICSHAKQRESLSGPHLTSPENEANNVVFSSSSLEDNTDHDLSRENSIHLHNGFPQMFSGDPTRHNHARHRSLTDDDQDVSVSWMWRVIETVTPSFLLREYGRMSIFVYIYVILLVWLLLVSGYIGLRILALEEQLNSLGALAELSLHYREYQEG